MNGRGGEAFTAFLRAELAKAEAYVRAAVGEAEAPDILLEGWLQLRHGWDGRRNRRWLVYLLLSRQIGRWRQENSKAEPVVGAEPVAADTAMAGGVGITAALHALSFELKETICLVYFADLSPAEVALVQGTKVSTVRKRISTAKALLPGTSILTGNR